MKDDLMVDRRELEAMHHEWRVTAKALAAAEASLAAARGALTGLVDCIGLVLWAECPFGGTCVETGAEPCRWCAALAAARTVLRAKCARCGKIDHEDGGCQ